MPHPESTVVQVKPILYYYQTRSWPAQSGGAYISTLRPPNCQVCLWPSFGVLYISG